MWPNFFQVVLTYEKLPPFNRNKSMKLFLTKDKRKIFHNPKNLSFPLFSKFRTFAKLR